MAQIFGRGVLLLGIFSPQILRANTTILNVFKCHEVMDPWTSVVARFKCDGALDEITQCHVDAGAITSHVNRQRILVALYIHMLTISSMYLSHATSIEDDLRCTQYCHPEDRVSRK